VTVLTKEKVEQVRRAPTSDNKAKYAQYFTPAEVAEYMVGMFADSSSLQASVLDPGAGEGILGLALASRLSQGGTETATTFIEIDECVFDTLKKKALKDTFACSTKSINGDFIKESARLLQSGERFTHVIMNPPYFKLQRNSNTSHYLMSCGINVTNIYAAFIWLGLLLLQDKGQLVAIVPRSFCNGPYFLKFREFISQSASIESIHTFSSRDKVFSRDKVLQENVIIHLAKKPQSKSVRVTYSSDQSFNDVEEAIFPANQIVGHRDSGITISIPAYASMVNLRDYAGCSLFDVNLEVSTGPVVDFRLKSQIKKVSGQGSVPLLYPAHMKDGQISWPLNNLPKKGEHYYPQAGFFDSLDSVGLADKCVSPSGGHYVAVRRFSSREEKRRIYAVVVDTADFAGGVAFENHLNYFHRGKRGFDADLAYGLSAYLNSSVLDEHFRSFSGHTQVNATDLRNIPYPSEDQLRRIGRVVLGRPAPIDSVVTPDLLKDCA